MTDGARGFAWSAALAAAFAVYWAFNPPDIPLLQPDSSGYMNGNPIRGWAYSALILAVGDPARLVAVQLAAYFAAAAFVGRELARITGTALAGAAFVVFAGVIRAVVEDCFTVLPEAAAMTVGLATSVVVGRFLSRPGLASGLLLVVLGGLLADLRPAMAGFGLMLLALSPFAAARRRAVFLAACALLLWPAVQATIRDPADATARRAFLALTLSGKYALLGETDAPPLARDLSAAAAEMRARIDAVDSSFVAYELRIVYAEHLRYRVWPDLTARHGADSDAQLAAALAPALAHPGAWLAQVARDLTAFWVRPDILTIEESRARARALEALAPSSLREVEPSFAPNQPAKTWAARICLAAGVAFSLAAFVAMSAGAAPFSAAVPFAYGAAAAVWGTYGSYAILHGAIPRYAFASWPQLGALLALAVGLAFVRLKALRR